VANEVKLPRLGQGMEAGTIVKWLKSPGDPVEKGEPLYELDTDKVTQEVEAEVAGVLLRIAVETGEVAVGSTIAWIGEEGEAVAEAEAPAAESDEPADDGAGQSAEKPARAPARDDDRDEGREAAAEEAEQQEQPSAGSRNGGRVKASPLARRIARERGVELSQIRGTGPEGRIVAEDVERAEVGAARPAGAAPQAAPAEARAEKLTSLQKTIARRMTEAWQVPVFQISMNADMTAAQALRAKLVERLREGDVKPTVSDLLTKAAAVALMRHPNVNVQFAEDELRYFPSANVGIAVATERGLVVPVVREVERKSVAEIAAARNDLVARARTGKLGQDDLAEGTFTISNLGMYGVDQFVAILNPPQAAILAVGAIEEKVVAEHGNMTVKPMLNMTLSCDHRALDGATAADFLRTVKTFLEEPALML
jgi:pyruvate dehydrogenase E2 component (dihydrolipoamide acetyltransferase)